MNRARVIMSILLLLLTSCAKSTTVVLPQDRVVKVEYTKRNSYIEVKTIDYHIIVDNRGRPGFIEQILGALVTKDIPLPREEMKCE